MKVVSFAIPSTILAAAIAALFGSGVSHAQPAEPIVPTRVETRQADLPHARTEAPQEGAETRMVQPPRCDANHCDLCVNESECSSTGGWCGWWVDPVSGEGQCDPCTPGWDCPRT